MRDNLRRAAYYLAFGSAAGIVFSIAVSQILLALSVASLLLSNERLEFPPVRLPLAVFFLTTLASLLLSTDPAAGMPQIRKFFVFAILLVIYSTFRETRQTRALIHAWAVIGSLSALFGLSQFLHRHQEAIEQRADHYKYLLDGRMTGFMNHWMTFGGEEMIVFLMLLSVLLFSRHPRSKWFGWPALAILGSAIGLTMTRSIFLLGVPLGLTYLLWNRSRVVCLVAVLLAAIGIALAPGALHERVISVFRPHGDIDSNRRHALCRAVGWQMIRKHPWFGVGPEQVGKQFDHYIPSDWPRPLPRGWYGHLHNVYFQYAAERGIPALLAMLWLIGKVLVDFLNYLHRSSPGFEGSAILHGAVAVILAVLAEGCFEHNLGDSEVLTMFLSVIACGYVVIRMGRPASDAALDVPESESGRKAEVAVEVI